MPTEAGSITVNAEKLFPIIKKSLYPHREIFLREMISNATDALNRFSFLFNHDNSFGREYEELRIDIRTDKMAGTISIEDNGDGMTRDQVKKNINEVAFSGTQKFLETYHPEAKMIGQFGLGFYSIFMVAREVRVETKSLRQEEGASLWSSEGDGQFHLADNGRTKRGTHITLFIDSDHKEFLETERLENLIRKYSDYMPYPIYLDGRCVNTIHAPWHLNINELTSKDYLEFYQKICPNTNDPSFWIYLNLEGHVNFRGLLYIPDRPAREGNIRLFCNRVFVQEFCTELVPEYLSFINGVIDTEDLPLNVSRDRFQEDKRTQIIKNHIKKRVAREIASMAKTKRADYLHFWDEYGLYVKFGAILDEQWFTELSPYFMFSSSQKNLTTLKDYLLRATTKYPNEIYYLTDRVEQAQHLVIFKQRDLEVLLVDNEVDFPILKRLCEESSDRLELKRIDTVVLNQPKNTDHEVNESEKANWNAFREYFAQFLPKETSISIESLPTTNFSAIFKMHVEDTKNDDTEIIKERILKSNNPERKKRRILVLNQENTLIQALYHLFMEDKANALLTKICEQIYKHALISIGEIKHEDLGTILSKAEDIMTYACETEIGNIRS